ncbi:MAG: FMN-binding protein [Clostridia bacterium]|nr:FMN-binding protein [Clostridia bacterium]
MRKKMIVLVLCIIGVLGVYIGIKYYLTFKEYKRVTSSLAIDNINFSAVKDGTYIGECDAKLVYAKVKVFVKGGKVEKIELLKHANGRGENAEVIPGKVVESQSLNVDTVSGATNSSKIILKAIENALKGKQSL